MAVYAYNNSLHSTVKMTPFFANYGCHPPTYWPIAKPPRNRTSLNHFQWMTSVPQLNRKGLERARETMRKYYHEKVNPAPVYQPANLVMLNGKNLETRRPAWMFDVELHGRFKVMKVMSPTARRGVLPSRWQIPDAFY
jgi:hypothetical protein